MCPYPLTLHEISDIFILAEVRLAFVDVFWDVIFAPSMLCLHLL